MKVFVAGSSGLVGSATAEKYEQLGHQVIRGSKKLLNLLDRAAVFNFIRDQQPDLIIDSAAKVGGIGANANNPTQFLSENLQIQCNLMDAALKYRIKKFVFLGSSCIYPRNCTQPIKEEYLLSGPLEDTNSAYAIAKIAGIEAVKAVRNQYGLEWISLMPTNVYGPRDNFDIDNSHVLPALIRKFIIAKENGSSEVRLWGDGTPLREFIYSEDLADAIMIAEQKYNEVSHLNIGSGEEISIKILAQKIANEIGYENDIVWDPTKPNGTPRKKLDSSKMNSLGWTPKWNLENGVARTIEWFKTNMTNGDVRI